MTLRIGQTIGPVTHFATVETDLPEAPTIEFQTSAHVLPRVRIEPVGEAARRLLPGTTGRVDLIALSCANPGERPLALGDADLKSKPGVRWEGHARERVLAGGVIERSRPFSVALEAGPNPGQRSDLITLTDGDGDALNYPLLWEVAAALKVSPAGVVISPERSVRNAKAVIRSLDGRDFRVLKVESTVAGVEAAEEGPAEGPTHTIIITGDPEAEPSRRVGDVVVTTDHPAQSRVRFAVFIPGARPAVIATEAKP